MAERPSRPPASVLLHPVCCRSPQSVRAAQKLTGRVAVFERREGLRPRVVLVDREWDRG